MEIFDRIADIESHLTAIRILTDKLVALSGNVSDLTEFNAIDTARLATQKEAEQLLKELEIFVRYGLKIGSSCNPHGDQKD